MSIEQIIGALLSIGGLGFMNFLVADRLETIELYDYSNVFVVGYSLLWSILDYFIYTFVLYILETYFKINHVMQVSLSLLVTLILAFVCTLVFVRPLNVIVRVLYGAAFGTKPYPLFGDSLKLLLNDKNSRVLVYLFTIDHKEIDCGYLENFDFNKVGHPKFELSNYDNVDYPTSYVEVRSWLKDPKYDAHQYVDLDSNLLMIVFKINMQY